MSYLKNSKRIEGTTLFDGQASRKGYNLNKMCFSFNEQNAREEFLANEEAYCEKFGLSTKQKQAINQRDVLGLLDEGGSIYYLAKFVGMLGLNMQDIGALQTGKTVDEFKAMLVKAGE